MKTLKALGLIVVVSAVVMIPLYGHARNGPVTHGEWARMVLRALSLEDNLPANAGPRVVFSTLSWKNSLAYPAERYLRARGTEVVGPSGARVVVATNGAAEVAYPVTVVRAGDYRLRLQLAGDPSRPGAAEITAVGEARPVREFTLALPAVPGWVDVGSAHLRPGGYTAAVMLPSGSTLQRLEVAPPCLTAIEPPGGWQEGNVATAEDVAVTALQALDLQWELPPAAAAIELVASDFRATGASPLGGSLSAEAGHDGLWLRGGARGVQALVLVDLPEPGLYTLSTFGLPGAAQGWLVDSCQKVILCPQPAASGGGPTWRPVLTAEFTAGRHSFAVTLPPGVSLGRVRIERKKSAPSDHVATLRRLGFDVGAAGPIPRDRTVAAMEFIRGRRPGLEQTSCGDVLPPDTLEAGLAEPAAVRGAAAGPTFSGQPPSGVGVMLPAPAVVPPVTPPVTPPGPPSTLPPVVPPVTAPPGPPPTLPPGPPPTIPPQPPGSPVTIVPTPPPGA
jgi:hypothetical protein